MATAQYVTTVLGEDTLVTATIASAGSASAGQIVALNASGQIDSTMLSVQASGSGSRTDTAASAISAGNLINFGPSGVRPADSTSGFPAHGFALAAVSSGSTGTFNTLGTLSGLSGLTKGQNYFLGPNGTLIAGSAAPTASGTIIQFVGEALSATELQFTRGKVTKNA